ncbi:MAG: BREX-1 system adenine-specific DNA-methyltransferase PglX [Paenibacillaceae bacterium]
MNKNAIQKYAIWARSELIEQVKQRAYQYAITDKGYGYENAAIIAGRVLSPDEKRQRQSFVELIKMNGFKQAVEEVAYTWFNRFVALRYMEVNDFLPSHVRVFSDASGDFNPEILKDVLHLDLEGLDKAKVSELLNANKTEELYRYLLLTQCNALNALLPEMFERMGAYTEMLLPNNILKPEGVIGRLVKDIPEEDFRDAVQIIGWLYQYYNTEPKQAVYDGLKKNIKITKENIPAATQLFTPDWIVRYMVENSLGRLWLESHPGSPLRANWKYYLDEAEQTPEVAERLRDLRSENAIKSPEDIKVMDCCMGSGHILVYAFDVLMQIYTSEGYSERDAAMLILEKNLYGLEIDRRAYQLAYFALMMKARQYNRRILTQGVRPQVYEPTGYADGMEYGSLVLVDKRTYARATERPARAV